MQEANYDETTIRDIITRMVDAWNHGNAADFAAPFAEGADFIAFEGTHLKGRQQIRAFHERLFDLDLKGSRLEGGVKFVRFLGPALAVMHGWGTTRLRGHTNAASSRDSMQLFVVTKREGEWHCDAMLNARRISMEQQLFQDQFATLSDHEQREVTHKISAIPH
jgi:uncharacterized protein (TIGR02246 family)